MVGSDDGDQAEQGRHRQAQATLAGAVLAGPSRQNKQDHGQERQRQ